jgi:hypothetical protein
MRLTLLSLGLAIAAAVFLLMYPVYSGLNNNRPSHATLLEVNGQWAIVPVLAPVVVALVPVMFPHRVIRLIAAAVLGGFALISGFTIGIFYWPAVVAMVVAAGMGRSGRAIG